MAKQKCQPHNFWLAYQIQLRNMGLLKSNARYTPASDPSSRKLTLSSYPEESRLLAVSRCRYCLTDEGEESRGNDFLEGLPSVSTTQMAWGWFTRATRFLLVGLPLFVGEVTKGVTFTSGAGNLASTTIAPLPHSSHLVWTAGQKTCRFSAFRQGQRIELAPLKRRHVLARSSAYRSPQHACQRNRDCNSTGNMLV